MIATPCRRCALVANNPLGTRTPQRHKTSKFSKGKHNQPTNATHPPPPASHHNLRPIDRKIPLKSVVATPHQAKLFTFPEVKMARGRKPCTYFRNWLFAVEGSPTMQTLMSPLSLMPSAVFLWTPPRSISRTPRLTWVLVFGVPVFRFRSRREQRSAVPHRTAPQSTAPHTRRKGGPGCRVHGVRSCVLRFSFFSLLTSLHQAWRH